MEKKPFRTAGLGFVLFALASELYQALVIGNLRGGPLRVYPLIAYNLMLMFAAGFSLMLILRPGKGKPIDRTVWKGCYKRCVIVMLVFCAAWPTLLCYMPDGILPIFSILGTLAAAMGILFWVTWPVVSKQHYVDPRNKRVPMLPTFAEHSEKRARIRKPVVQKREQAWKQTIKENKERKQKELSDYGLRVIRKKEKFTKQLRTVHPEIPFPYLCASNVIPFPDPIIPISEDSCYKTIPNMFSFSSIPVSKIRISNDRRLETILKILTNSGVDKLGNLDTLLTERFDIEALLPFEPDKLRNLTCSYGPVPAHYYQNMADTVASWKPGLRAMINARMEYYSAEYRIMKSGEEGEKAVQRLLESHQDALFFLPNLRLEFPANGERNSVETDFLVLSPIGVAALEVKNYGSSGNGKLIASPDGRWFREYNLPGRRTVCDIIESPFAQNDRHIAYLEREINRILNRSMDDRIYLDNIVVIANDNIAVEAQLPSHQHLTRVGGLYGTLTASRTKVMSAEEAKAVYDQLKARSLPGLGYPINDYSAELKDTLDMWLGLQKLTQDFPAAAAHILARNPELREI